MIRIEMVRKVKTVVSTAVDVSKFGAAVLAPLFAVRLPHELDRLVMIPSPQLGQIANDKDDVVLLQAWHLLTKQKETNSSHIVL